MRAIDIRTILHLTPGTTIKITTINEEDYELPLNDVHVIGELVQLQSTTGSLFLETSDIEKIWIM